MSIARPSLDYLLNLSDSGDALFCARLWVYTLLWCLTNLDLLLRTIKEVHYDFIVDLHILAPHIELEGYRPFMDFWHGVKS